MSDGGRSPRDRRVLAALAVAVLAAVAVVLALQGGTTTPAHARPPAARASTGPSAATPPTQAPATAPTAAPPPTAPPTTAPPTSAPAPTGATTPPPRSAAPASPAPLPARPTVPPVAPPGFVPPTVLRNGLPAGGPGAGPGTAPPGPPARLGVELVQTSPAGAGHVTYTAHVTGLVPQVYAADTGQPIAGGGAEQLLGTRVDFGDGSPQDGADGGAVECRPGAAMIPMDSTFPGLTHDFAPGSYTLRFTASACGTAATGALPVTVR